MECHWSAEGWWNNFENMKEFNFLHQINFSKKLKNKQTITFVKLISASQRSDSNNSSGCKYNNYLLTVISPSICCHENKMIAKLQFV